jgi:hypothetical protein
VDDAQNTYDAAQRDLISKGATNLQKRNEAEQLRVANLYDTTVTQPKNKAAELALQGQQKIAEIQAQAGATERSAALNPINTEMAASSHRLDDLAVLQGFSDNLGDPTFLTSTKIGGRSLADIISAAGLGSQALQTKAGQAQAFRAVTLSMIRDLRAGGAATGEPRSNQDLSFVEGMVPSEMESQATRNAIMSYIQQVNQRRMEYGAEVNRLANTPEYQNNVGGAMLAARQGMPDMLQTMPSDIAWTGGQAGINARKDWLAQHVHVGTFYRTPSVDATGRPIPSRMQTWNGVRGEPNYMP